MLKAAHLHTLCVPQVSAVRQTTLSFLFNSFFYSLVRAMETQECRRASRGAVPMWRSHTIHTVRILYCDFSCINQDTSTWLDVTVR